MTLSSFIKSIHAYTPIVFTLIVFTATALWLSYLELTHPLIFTQDDASRYFLPAYAYNWQALIENQTIPLINFHQYLGQTWLDLSQTGVLYLPAYVSSAISLLIFQDYFHTIDIFAILHWLTGAIAMLFFLRQLKFPYIISLLGAFMWVVFPYFNFMASWWPTESLLLVFLPLNFIFFDKLISKPSVTIAAYLGSVKAWFIFAGYPQHILTVSILEIIIIALLFFKNTENGNLKTIARLLLIYSFSLIITALLAAPLLLPTFEAKTFSYERATPVTFKNFIYNSIAFKDFINAQRFTYSSNTIHDTNSHILHISITNLAFILLLLNRRIRRLSFSNHVAFYSLCGLITFLMSTSLYQYIYAVPILNWFRGPFKNFPFFLFFLTITICSVATTISRTKNNVIKVSVYLTLLTSIFLNITVVIFNEQKAHNTEMWEISHPRTPKVIDLAQAKEGRIASFGYNDSRKQAHQYFLFNYASLFNVNSFTGYSDPLLAKHNQWLTDKQAWENLGVNYKLPDQAKLDQLSKWSVRHIITTNTRSNRQHLKKFNQLELTFQDDQLLLYKNTEALPYVYSSANPRERINHNFGINQIDIFPNNTEPDRIIVNIIPLPRYIVYIDDVKVGRVKFKKGPLAIQVPPNTQHILIKYENPLFIYGSGISLATTLTGILLILIKRVKKDKNLFKIS